jgi:hypothetical protein
VQQRFLPRMPTEKLRKLYYLFMLQVGTKRQIQALEQRKTQATEATDI